MKRDVVLEIVHPTRLFITAKASDEGLDSTFKLTVSFNVAPVVEEEAAAETEESVTPANE